MSREDKTLYAIVAIILFLLFFKKLRPVVTASVGGVPVTAEQQNLGTNIFDYSVCAVSIDVLIQKLPIRVCLDPATGEAYPIEEYPNGGSTAQIQILSRDTEMAKLSNKLNGVGFTPYATTGPQLPLLDRLFPVRF